MRTEHATRQLGECKTVVERKFDVQSFTANEESQIYNGLYE